MTIITTDANEVVADVHDWMPVILEDSDVKTWLTADDQPTLESILDPCAADTLRAYPFSKQVNNPVNYSPDQIEEIDVGEQVSFGEFAK